jgi:hypothetical protein
MAKNDPVNLDVEQMNTNLCFPQKTLQHHSQVVALSRDVKSWQKSLRLKYHQNNKSRPSLHMCILTIA